MDLKNKRVLVAGTGISGIGAAGLLLKTDADIILYDGNEKLTEEGVREKLPKNSREVSIIIGASPLFPVGSSNPQSSRCEQGRYGHWTLLF